VNAISPRIALVVLALLCGWLVPSASVWAQQGGPRIGIEKAMREYNGRYHHFTGSYVSWPDCRGCGGKGKTPPKPHDGLYPDSQVTDPAMCVELVTALVDAFYDAHIGSQPLSDKFIKIEGHGAPPYLPYTVADFPKTWGGTVNVNNYVSAFHKVSAYILELQATTFVAGDQTGLDDGDPATWDRIEFKAAGLIPYQLSIPEAKLSAMDHSPLGWNNQSWAPCNAYNPEIMARATVLARAIGLPQDPELEYRASLYVQRGRIHADLTGHTGEAACYVAIADMSQKLKLEDSHWSEYPPDEPQTPFDVETDSRYHLWKMGIPTGSQYYSEPINASDTPPAWPSDPVLTFEYAPEDTWRSGSTVEWSLSNIVFGIRPDYDTSPEGPAHCPSSCAGGRCPAGAAGGTQAALGSVSYTVGLGMLDDKTSAGYLYIDEDASSAALSTPAVLQATVPVGDARLELIRTGGAGTPVRQVKTPFSLADVVTISATEYQISCYHAADVEKPGSLWQPLAGKTPYKTITLLSPGGDLNELRITETQGGVSRVRLFKWDTTELAWELADGLSDPDIIGTAKSREVLREEWNGDQTQRTETRILKEGDGTVTSKVVQVYQKHRWGEELIQETVSAGPASNPDAVTDTTLWHFYTSIDDSDAEHDNYGQLKAHVSDTGYWEHYTYGVDGELIRTIAQSGDQAYDDSDLDALAASNVVTLHTSTSASLANVGDSGDEVIQETIVQAPGLPASYHYVVLVSGTTTVGSSRYYDTWDISCASADPLSGYASTTQFLDALFADADHLGHLVSKTRRYAATNSSGDPQPHAFEVATTESPDGTMVFYDRSTPSTTVVSSGTPDATKTAIIFGTRQTTVVDSAGTVVSTLMERIDPDVNSGQWFVVSLTKTTATDEFGRPTATAHYFGTEAAAEVAQQNGTPAYSTSRVYGCCGIDESVDRQGLRTEYQMDALGRAYRTSSGIIHSSGNPSSGYRETYTSYDAPGRATMSWLELSTGPANDVYDAGTDVLLSKTTYDLAGRSLVEEDGAGKKTFYTYRRVVADSGHGDFGKCTDEVTDYSGPVFDETRTYPHNQASGPVHVTWTDSHGRRARSFTATVSTDWNGNAPVMVEAFVKELSRTTYTYDALDRQIKVCAYHTVPEPIDLKRTGDEGTDYHATRSRYNVLGEVVGTRDAMGNVSAAVYDGVGRRVSMWAGVGTTTEFEAMSLDGRTEPTAAGLLMVSKQVYDTYGRLTTSYRVGPIADAPDPSASLDADYVHTEFDAAYAADATRSSWTKPEKGPWTLQEQDVEGRTTFTKLYKKQDDGQGGWEPGALLSQSEQVYDAQGRLSESRRYSVEGGTPGKYLRSEYIYDDAGRQCKLIQPTGGFTKTEYDGAGRVLRTISASAEGSGAGEDDPTTFAGDTVLTETVYEYNEAGNVVLTAVYDRNPGAECSGLLSESLSDCRATYVGTWYDDVHRVRATVNYGTQRPEWAAAHVK
jgi:YD repeat-containing protein